MDAGERGVWERIAHSFDRTRSRPWPFVVEFLRGLPQGSRVLDLMGGNGRHTRAALDLGHDAVWLDWSRPAAGIVSRRIPKAPAVVGDAVRLPFSDAAFDAVLYIAGLHGVRQPEDRLESLREVRRVLRPGGVALISVWDRNAPRFRNLGSDVVELVVPWRAEGHREERFYHLYTEEALKREVKAAGMISDEPRTEGENLVLQARCGSRP